MTNERLHQNGGCGCGCGGHGGEASSTTERRRYWEQAPDDEVVCHCANIDKRTIVSTIRNGAFTKPLVKVLTGLGRGRPCPHDNQCLDVLDQLLALYGQTTLSDALIQLEEP